MRHYRLQERLDFDLDPGGNSLPHALAIQPPANRRISNQWVGVGCPHPAGGGFNTGRGNTISVPNLLDNCKCLEGFVIREWDVILPEHDGTPTLTAGATLAAR